MGGEWTTLARGRVGTPATPATLAVAVAIAVGIAMMGCEASRAPGPEGSVGVDPVRALPPPDLSGGLPLHAALAARRSVREFAATALTDEAVGQLLWAAQGVTSRDGRRTAPSAGALYPLELYILQPSGTGRYLPAEHALVSVMLADQRPALTRAAMGQEAVAGAWAVVVIVGQPARTATRYGARATRYMWLEAGHVAQNVLLEAVSLGLAAVPVGAFDDAAVATVLGLPDGEVPLYLIPVGHPR